MFSLRRTGCVMVLVFFSQVSAASLQIPHVFLDHDVVLATKSSKLVCTDIAVFKGDLVFPSKYEGDDISKDDVNEQALSEYITKSKAMRDLQQLSAKFSDMIFKGKGTQADINCLVGNWVNWASANAMLNVNANHIGYAVRKWTLAAMVMSYLKVKVNLPDAIDKKDAQLIEHWFANLAEQVKKDYYGRGPDKANNHDYWAAFSVMATAIVTQRQDLFDWSYGVFVQAMNQITDDGYLPNELRRQTRSLSYHSFALLPLSSMAAFAADNNKPTLDLNNHAFARLVKVVLANVDDSASMSAKAGHPQIKLNLKESGRLAWLAPYESLTHDPALLPLIKQTMPLKSSMLGGDQTWLYLRDQTELYPSK